jgi:UDP-N-acetylmuramyl pentapeptide phosphotransferase/UDP-N-acetylglucosamine-1-phosphate transferase
MKPYLLTGIILIVIGVIAFGYQGISYTTRDKVVDLGPIHVTAEKTKTIPLPPLVGGIALVGGILVLVVGSRKGQ